MEHSQETSVHEPVVSESVPQLSPAEDLLAEDGVLCSETRTKSLHGHSDSMVTVRLSTKEQQGDDTEFPTSGMSDDTAHNEHSSIEPDAESNIEEEQRVTEEEEEADTRHTSTSSFSAMGGNRESVSLADSPNSHEDQLDEPSNVASPSTPVQHLQLDISGATNSTINQGAMRPRSESLHSSQSSGSSVNVDWEKLDKNEEEEEHNEGTDEVYTPMNAYFTAC